MSEVLFTSTNVPHQEIVREILVNRLRESKTDTIEMYIFKAPSAVLGKEF